MMTELKPEEILVETADDNAVAVIEDIGEDIIEKSGMSFGKTAGIVAGVALVAATIYGAVMYFKNKNAKDDEDDVIDSEAKVVKTEDESEE